MASSGLHANGYSLVRHVLLTTAGWPLDRYVDELGRTLGEELLEPTRVYARDCLALIEAAEVHALAHITGGGLAANLARVLPADMSAQVRRGTWTPQPIFELVARVGQVERPELEATLNLGVGMVAVVPPRDVDAALAALSKSGVSSWVCGEVIAGAGGVDLTGDYAS
jgi:phosphoribosylformylglycinamidine cyclo-ligase